MNSTEIRAAISLAWVYVLRMLGLFMVMPVLAILATDYPDYAPWLVGLAIGGYGLTQAILQIPMGVLSDRIGRKPVILGGLLMFAVGSAVAAYADSLTGVVVGRFLQGAGAIAGAVMALAGDVSREEQRSKVMAVIGIAIGFSFYLALLIGPLIADFYGLTGIFAVTAILAVLALPLVQWAVPNATNAAPSGDTLPALVDVRRLVATPSLMKLNVSVFLLHMLITLLFVQLPGLLSEYDLQLNQHWSVYLPVLVASVFGMAALMSQTRKVGQSRIIRISIGILALSTLGFVIAETNFWWLMFVVWMFFTGFNYLEANFPAMVSSIAPAGKKGSAMGIYASAQFLGAFAGGIISGLFEQFLQAEVVFVFASVTCAAWMFWLKGLESTESLKRYTLDVNLTQTSADVMSQQLADLDGVRDITLIPDQSVAYLKVDTSAFDLPKARRIAKNQVS